MIAPAEGLGVERERGRSLAQSLLLVAEDRRREEVEEPVLAGLRAVRMVKTGRRLEDEPARTAAPDEVGELLDARHAVPAAADLRAQAARRDLVERNALEVDSLVLPLAAGLDHRKRSIFVL